MAYGVSADKELIKQFQKVCEFCGYQDKSILTRVASKTLVKLFWSTHTTFAKYDLKSCEKKVFAKLVKKKADFIMVDGPHVEAYLTEMAHEVTKIIREDNKILRSHPYVTLCKAKMEEIARGTVVHGYHTDMVNDKGNVQEDKKAK